MDDLTPEATPLSLVCHSESPGILPVQWCLKNGIGLERPRGYLSQDFDWADYLKQSGTETAPDACFPDVRYFRFLPPSVPRLILLSPSHSPCLFSPLSSSFSLLPSLHASSPHCPHPSLHPSPPPLFLPLVVPVPTPLKAALCHFLDDPTKFK